MRVYEPYAESSFFFFVNRTIRIGRDDFRSQPPIFRHANHKSLDVFYFQNIPSYFQVILICIQRCDKDSEKPILIRRKVHYRERFTHVFGFITAIHVLSNRI